MLIVCMCVQVSNEMLYLLPQEHPVTDVTVKLLARRSARQLHARAETNVAMETTVT